MKPLYKGITADELAEIRKEYHGKIIAIKEDNLLFLYCGNYLKESGEWAEKWIFGTLSGQKILASDTETGVINGAIKDGYKVIWFDGRPSMIQYLEKKGMA